MDSPLPAIRAPVCPPAPVKNVSFHSPLAKSSACPPAPKKIRPCVSPRGPKSSACPPAPKKTKVAFAAVLAAFAFREAGRRLRRALREASDGHTSMGGGTPLEQ